MFGRPRHRRRHAVRWLGAAAGLGVAAATAFALAPAASAATTVNAQLSVSGVATKDNVLGGTVVGVHPGDTVDFKASALPTAGLENVPVLGGILGGVLGSLTASNFQVVATFGANFPRLAGRSITLGGPTTGKCAGAPDAKVTFPSAGTYSFTWKVQYVLQGLLGCSQNGLNSADLNQLKQAGVAINASNQWTGRIVAATDPPKGGISIQLPSVGVNPSLPVVGQLPPVTLPGVSLPTLHAGLPGTSKSTPSAAQHSSSAPGVNYTPPGLTIPDEVVPKGYGAGSASGAGSDTTSGSGGGGALQYGGKLIALAGHQSAPGQAPTGRSAAPGQDLATAPVHGPRVPPVALAIAAVVAFSLVTAGAARRYLLHR